MTIFLTWLLALWAYVLWCRAPRIAGGECTPQNLPPFAQANGVQCNFPLWNPLCTSLCCHFVQCFPPPPLPQLCCLCFVQHREIFDNCFGGIQSFCASSHFMSHNWVYHAIGRKNIEEGRSDEARKKKKEQIKPNKGQRVLGRFLWEEAKISCLALKDSKKTFHLRWITK